MTQVLLTKKQLAGLVQLADAHKRADEYRAGHYEWQDGGACSIGCTVIDGKKLGILPKNTKSCGHAAISKCFGVPLELVYLQDRIFEGLDGDAQREWTPRFLRALRPGVDLSMVWPKFALWLLTDGPVRHGLGKRADVDAAVTGVADLYREWIETGTKPRLGRWRTAAAYATAAAWAAANAVDAANAAARAEIADRLLYEIASAPRPVRRGRGRAGARSRKVAPVVSKQLPGRRSPVASKQLNPRNAPRTRSTRRSSLSGMEST